jgi:hypothetical protein
MPLKRSRDVSMIDVIDRVLDKGIVIDYWARVSLLGVDIFTGIDARVVVASIDTYTDYADRIERTGVIARRSPRGPSTSKARAIDEAAVARRFESDEP